MDLSMEAALRAAPAHPDGPVRLFAEAGHAVYWLGTSEETSFRCNTYLVCDGDQALLIDPGDRRHFSRVRAAVATVLGDAPVTGLIIGHQDPDVAASFGDWLSVNPAAQVFTSPRTQLLLPHYGTSGYRFYDIEAEPEYRLPSGHCLYFVGAPFLHSPMAFATYDEASGPLFTGDVFAAVDPDWRLVVDEFAPHTTRMDLFHLDYMASGLAARGFAERIRSLAPTALLPQHGSIIPGHFVADATAYLEQLRCGLDLIYPDPA